MEEGKAVIVLSTSWRRCWDPEAPRKLPTEAGRRLGLLTEQKQGRDGEYTAVLFNEAAQRYIIAHLFEIMQG